MRQAPVALAVLLLVTLEECAMAQSSEDKRRGELERLRRVLPACPAFEEWLQATGELPPDFDALPSVPYLQDPLVTMRGSRQHRVTRAEWPARRKEMAELAAMWLVGHAPPPPGNVRAVMVDKTQDRGHEVWHVRLEFGPEHAATLNCTLYLPNGKTPAPVFLCDSDRYLPWAEGAMEKGFAVCIYNAPDNADESKAYANLFGPYDWSAFRRRGWSAGRAIDWLETLDFIDARKVCIAGHSRSAKQAMVGAAFDERIAAVIASSPGSGGSMPYRYFDQSYFGESAENLTRVFPDWVSLRVRFFCGRENKLPADSHFLFALIAPRPVLMSTAINDWVEGTWTAEQVYNTLHPVYELLGAPENLALRYRPGQHGTDDETSRAYSEFAQLAVSGGSIAARFPFTPYHRWDYEQWAKAHAPRVNLKKLPRRTLSDPTVDAQGKRLTPEQWQARRSEIRRQIGWLLGEGPAYQPMPVQFGVGESDEDAKVLARDRPGPPEKAKCRFGMGVNGNVYYPSPTAAGSGAKLPGVIWLAPFHCASGYIGMYRAGDIAHLKLAHAGFVTLAFDPIGTGGRQEERRSFYERYPEWSLMGKMVLDARHAVDALAACPAVDPERIYLVGYALGGMVGVFTAALDDRVAGVASVAGFTPFRTDTAASGTGGIRRWSHLYGWLPRLGAFVGHESKVPVDFSEMLACVAPRPMLTVALMQDWHATHPEVVIAVSQASKAYQLLGAGGKVELLSPDDWNRLTNERQDEVISWLKRQMGGQ